MKNLIYINTHDSGRYISPYGYAMPTPNLQKFAEQSLLFRQACCTGPTCSPSRAGMLTGMAPHTAGMLGLAHRGFRIYDYQKHLSSYLHEQGFHTALSGGQHETVHPEADLGYEELLKGPKGSDISNAEEAARFLKDYRDSRPFFLAFGMYSTHRDYPKDTGEINPDYVMPAFPLADNAANRLDMAQYMRSVQIADQCVGIVLDALRESGHEKDTIVLFTTDHGIAMPHMKCHLYDTGIGVSLMLSVPGYASMGHASDALVSHVDVFPTLCDLLEIPKPQWLQGKSMLPILQDTSAEINEEIFSEVTYHAAYEPMRCIRTKDFKLIRFYDNHNRYVPSNVDASAPKTFLTEAGYFDRVRPREMLFDLRIDPVERENLAGDSQYREIYRKLSDKLLAWMERTDDPLLKYRYRVPAPEGAVVNKLECMDPRTEDFE